MTDWPSSIRGINDLPEEHKFAIYKTLLPEWLLEQISTCKQLPAGVGDGQAVVYFFRCPKGSRAMEVTVKRHITDIDPVLYLNMTDTFNAQLLVLLVVVNDLDSPRFNTDFDQHGNRTQFGIVVRNLEAEQAAMQAGLSPGQIRQGLRVFKRSVPVFEQFVSNMGHDIFFIEPLAYHNAIIFERYGFNYLYGHKEMIRIHEQFLPGGELHAKLTPENAFRHSDAWKTIRGRSWAIHDGILGHPFTGFQMYKRIGRDAGINTFPDAQW
jgi:hypothetical protein